MFVSVPDFTYIQNYVGDTIKRKWKSYNTVIQ